MTLVLSSASCSKMEQFINNSNKQNIPVETVDYHDSKSVSKYLYSLRDVLYSDFVYQPEYPSLDHLQYLFFYEQKKNYNCSILVDYSHGKFLYDCEKNLVMSYPGVPKDIKDLTEEDTAGIENLLTNQDIFHWTSYFDGTGGQTYGEYEEFWGFSLLFDDGSAFVTSGAGNYEAGWPDKYYELKDALFALAEN